MGWAGCHNHPAGGLGTWLCCCHAKDSEGRAHASVGCERARMCQGAPAVTGGTDARVQYAVVTHAWRGAKTRAHTSVHCFTAGAAGRGCSDTYQPLTHQRGPGWLAPASKEEGEGSMWLCRQEKRAISSEQGQLSAGTGQTCGAIRAPPICRRQPLSPCSCGDRPRDGGIGGGVQGLTPPRGYGSAPNPDTY